MVPANRGTPQPLPTQTNGYRTHLLGAYHRVGPCDRHSAATCRTADLTCKIFLLFFAAISSRYRPDYFEQIDPTNSEDIKSLENHEIFGVRVNIDPATSNFDIVFSTKALILELLHCRWS